RVGTVLGAHMGRAGHSVVMLARGQRAQHIETHGLVLTGLVELTQQVAVLTDPAALRSAATLVVATKTPGTAEALARLRHLDLDPAFSLQTRPVKNEMLAGAAWPE